MNKRFEVFYSGMVQGVGFRYNALQVSRNFAVVGTVQNLPDGRVKMVVEGEVKTVEQFVREVAETTHGRVTHSEVNEYPSVGDIQGFRIVR